MAAAKKAFTKLASAFYATPRWTLRNFKVNLQEGMDGESWKMMLPGIRSSAQVVELKESMRVMDAMTDEELDGAEGRGCARCRVAGHDDGVFVAPQLFASILRRGRFRNAID